ncbi:hypothetical protein BASA81_014825 [Batrachochytrium salamandrivorans]|nr:hypothetical protein BASA81_014825 [Batrachochytrium salamandrivorans]
MSDARRSFSFELTPNPLKNVGQNSPISAMDGLEAAISGVDLIDISSRSYSEDWYYRRGSPLSEAETMTPAKSKLDRIIAMVEDFQHDPMYAPTVRRASRGSALGGCRSLHSFDMTSAPSVPTISPQYARDSQSTIVASDDDPNESSLQAIHKKAALSACESSNTLLAPLSYPDIAMSASSPDIGPGPNSNSGPNPDPSPGLLDAGQAAGHSCVNISDKHVEPKSKNGRLKMYSFMCTSRQLPSSSRPRRLMLQAIKVTATAWLMWQFPLLSSNTYTHTYFPYFNTQPKHLLPQPYTSRLECILY